MSLTVLASALLSLSTLSGLSNISSQSTPQWSNNTPQVCEVQFETIAKSESPWERLQYVKNVRKTVQKPYFELDEIREMPTAVASFLKSENGASGTSNEKTGYEVFNSTLKSSWISFETVDIESGRPIARYSSSWVNAEQGKVRLEICRLK